MNHVNVWYVQLPMSSIQAAPSIGDNNNYIMSYVVKIMHELASDLPWLPIYTRHHISGHWYNEPAAASQSDCLYWRMHGLAFKTSKWLLAGSTRYVAISVHFVHSHTRAEIIPQRGTPHTQTHQCSYGLCLAHQPCQPFNLASHNQFETEVTSHTPN